jgi:hypothetical protein
MTLPSAGKEEALRKKGHVATERNIFINFVVKFIVDLIARADVEQISKSCKKENIHMLFS